MKRWWVSNAAVSFVHSHKEHAQTISFRLALCCDQPTKRFIASNKVWKYWRNRGRIIPEFMNAALIQANMTIVYALHYTYQKMTKEWNYCDPNFKHCLNYLRGAPVEPLRRISWNQMIECESIEWMSQNTLFFFHSLHRSLTEELEEEGVLRRNVRQLTDVSTFQWRFYRPCSRVGNDESCDSLQTWVARCQSVCIRCTSRGSSSKRRK